VLTAVYTQSGGLVAVRLINSTTEPPTTEEHAEETTGTTDEHETDAATDEHATEAGGEAHTEEVDEGPSPIAPEVKELAWGAGAFIVLAIVLRYVAFPKLRKGMTARYDSIRQGFEDADTLRADARGAVAQYEQALAGVKAEAAAVVDAARQQLESERQARITEVNARISERRSAAAAEAEAVRQAAAGQVNAAVGTVASRAVELATGKRPSESAVSDAVNSVTAVGAGR
jgi:F-type H+-transporting ATPase subunit b